VEAEELMTFAAPRIALLGPVAFTCLFSCSKPEEAPPPPAKKSQATTESSSPSKTTAAPVPEPPASLGKINVPKDNPTTPEKVELGRKLFFDKRLSADGSRACYSCHQNEDGTGGHDPVAIGAKEKKLTRTAPIMWNVAYLPRLYWDGRSDSLEAQAKGALTGGNMGLGEEGLPGKAQELEGIPEYKRAFDAAFPGDGLTPETIVMAIASYERTLFCGDTAFDRFNAGDASALSDEQKKGYQLFIGKAGCNNCHTPPFFSDAYTTEQGAYHNTGIGTSGKKEAEVDVGRMKVTENPSDWAAFKTPSLRNITKSPPYFHDGSRATLEEAVRFMAGGGEKNKNRDPKLEDKKLSDEEIRALIAFLGSLECTGKLVEATPP
jgi:cytochrome c peroxidase